VQNSKKTKFTLKKRVSVNPNEPPPVELPEISNPRKILVILIIPWFLKRPSVQECSSTSQKQYSPAKKSAK